MTNIYIKTSADIKIEGSYLISIRSNTLDRSATARLPPMLLTLSLVTQKFPIKKVSKACVASHNNRRDYV